MKKFAVIGLGKFGFHVAKALYEDHNEVVAIDADPSRVQAIDPYSSEALVMDSTDKEALQALGLERMDGVIVSTGTNIAVSILLCQYLVELGVKRIMIKAINDDHATILQRLGATEVIHPERDVALRIAHSLSMPNILDFIPLSKDFELIQVGPPAEFLGKTLKDLNLRHKYNVHVIAIKDSGTEAFRLVPSADYIIRAEDILIMLGKIEDIQKIRDLR
ncbi:MAG TPA: TrkA family potassium uptake protein [candidate division Zixibacteria bacterium]|nr:TrkA family potassium uptake protein [candidate division Zixibacteria bacterium]